MSESGEDLQRTPLEAEHVALGARMGPFGGWYLPIEYAGTLAEHEAVRERAGVFDVSHLGKVIVHGAGALACLQRALTNDVAAIQVGGAGYGMALNARGGIVDDLITYRLGEDRYLVVPNAANVEAVEEVLASHAGGDAGVVPRPDLCTIAVQGPRAFDLVGRVVPEALELEYMHGHEVAYQGKPVVVARSGYTGERGFELMPPADLAPGLWRSVLEAGEDLGLAPCGLGARDTLRLEMGYPLHGNDISQQRTPLEAGLTWAVAFDKGDFTGRDALLRQREEGVPARLWGLRMEGKLIPRSHYGVFVGDEHVGEVTSGTFSPTLRIGVALAYLTPRDRFSAGDRVEVDVRGRRGDAVVVHPPFVDRSPK